MTKRIPSFLIIFGLFFVLIGLMLSLFLSDSVGNGRVVNALPAGHPPITPTGATSEVGSYLNTTRADFFLPGTQPNQLEHEILAPLNCTFCHGENYSNQTEQPAGTETWDAWSGSMMAQAARDPIFYAALDIANVDAAFSGELCLRCHVPRAWLDGRVQDGQLDNPTSDDLEGIQCEVCHRMVDPIYDDENPHRDISILDALTSTVSSPGNAAYILDPRDYRRGPLNITDSVGIDPHQVFGAEATLQSPFHSEGAFCGTCHDIDNPLLAWNEISQTYTLDPLDQPAESDELFPIERTYSEWLLSDYNTPDGIYAPQFGGNKTHVSTCQDCHMRDITGLGGVPQLAPTHDVRDNYPLHDLTGANTWVPQIIPQHPTFSATFNNQERLDALNAGIDRARYMLQNAALLDASFIDSQLVVTITNQSGHKLPTGYVEGRRMWLQVEAYDDGGTLVYTSGMYNVETAVLDGYHIDSTLKVYESLHGLSEDWAAELGLTAGHSFHFILNNVILHDNRIPPCGYNFEAFNAAGAAPYLDSQPNAGIYADGQNWDTTMYDLPITAVTGTVRLMHQIVSKEYIEFLRDNNPNPGQNNGEILFDLWEANEKSKPEVMSELDFDLSTVSSNLINPCDFELDKIFLPSVIKN